MATFTKSSKIEASARQLYHYHCNPGAFGRLSPAWEPVQVKEKDEGISEGLVRHLKIGPGPFKLTWKAIHEEFEEDRQFVDRQLSGPFQSWRHLHRFEDVDGGATLQDQIEFHFPLRLPLGFLLKSKLERMFAYRHRQTARDLEVINRYPGPTSDEDGPALRIGVTGSSGMLGRALTSLLGVAGHKVVRLRRGHSQATDDSAAWWPEPDLEGLEGLDAVVHLAGETVAQLWTKSAREKILFSRSEGTRRLCEALAKLKSPPKVLISGSATGFYPQNSDGPVDESSRPGDDFLSEVCQRWEDATEAAEAAGIRVCHLRIGLVLSLSGGFLVPQMPAFQMGVGAVLGKGQQMQPFIDRDDLVASIYHLLNRPNLRGPFNATAPQPVSQRGFATELARSLGRPLFLSVPESPFRVLLRDQADVLFRGVEAVPSRLLESGFQFLSPTLEESLYHQLGRY